MLSVFEALLLGVVEGITEFLPISSTGHLILSTKLLGIPESNFVKSFEIIIQLGAILAVFMLYGRRFFIKRKNILLVLCAFIPTGVIGLAFYRLIKTYFLGNSLLVIISLITGGLLLILFEKSFLKNSNPAKTLEQMTYRDALIIGFIQSISIIPGVSRAAATIIGGLSLKYDRSSVAEFSFLLAVPTMLAATGFDLLKNYSEFSSNQLGSLSIGFTVSFITAILSVKWLVKYVKNHDFTLFGVYRILIGVFALFII